MFQKKKENVLAEIDHTEFECMLKSGVFEEISITNFVQKKVITIIKTIWGCTMEFPPF